MKKEKVLNFTPCHSLGEIVDMVCVTRIDIDMSKWIPFDTIIDWSIFLYAQTQWKGSRKMKMPLPRGWKKKKKGETKRTTHRSGEFKVDTSL